MKVLWLSHIQILPVDFISKNSYPGGNWISSLMQLVEDVESIELGIAFFGDETISIQSTKGTSYFQIKQTKKNKIQDLLFRWEHKIDSDLQKKSILNIINKFNPDVIHIFGTEALFGLFINEINIPTVIQLQGLLNPCLNAWKIPGLTNFKLIINSTTSLFLRGAGLFHDYYRFRNKAKREIDILNKCSNYIGRTHWDKAITRLYSPNSNYFHCDEVLRDSFYKNKWVNHSSEVFVISSTINADIYKGLDVILKTADLLCKNTDLKFEWNIYGVNKECEYVHLVENLLKIKSNENNVNFKGIVNENELVKALLNSNIFVHCSYIDNSPNSICESQIIGLPVISTNVGGISTLISNDYNGILVPPNDPHYLAQSIIELSLNPNKMTSISDNSYMTAHKRHNKNTIVNDLINIYNIISRP